MTRTQLRAQPASRPDPSGARDRVTLSPYQAADTVPDGPRPAPATPSQTQYGPAPGGPARGLVGEPSSKWSAPDAHGLRSRTLHSADGKEGWYQWKSPGQRRDYFSRSYKDKGREFYEVLKGNQHSRMQLLGQAFRNAKREGSVRLTDKQGKDLGVEVHGKLTPAQQDQLRKAIQDLPPALRKYARSIAVVDNLGQQGTRHNGHTRWESHTLGKTDSKGRIALDRRLLKDPKKLFETLAHEAGHGLQVDKARKLGPEWGKKSVSGYGNTDPYEDYAETVAYVAKNWKSLVNGGHGGLLRTAGQPIPGAGQRSSDITRRPSATKILQVLRAMGWQSSGQN
ncbi:MAG: hypothetical protein AB7S38_34060 [Vulcanimicrobiota bacterium]